MTTYTITQDERSSLKEMLAYGQIDAALECLRKLQPNTQEPLTVQEVEQILAQHNYELHGDRARYIVRMTEQAHGYRVKAPQI